MAKKWIRLLCDHVEDRHLLPANADVERDAAEADRMVAAGHAVELAEPPQRTAFVAPPPRPPAPEAAALDAAAEQAVLPAGRPRGRPPKARTPETVPPSGGGDDDEDGPAVNED